MTHHRNVIAGMALVALLCIGGSASAQVVINGNVYGGGWQGQLKNPSENVYANTTVTINDGTVEGSVFGGGAGIETDKQAGLVEGNTTVTMKGGTVERSIYGGGQLGSVGTFTGFTQVNYTEAPNVGVSVLVPTECNPNTGTATVNLVSGFVGKNGSKMPIVGANPDDDDRGWIFCGGQGEADSINYPNCIAMGVVNTTYLTISGGVVTASVYGGCENGLVLTDTHVDISDGQIGTGYNADENKFDAAYTDTQWQNAINAVNSEVEADINTAAADFHECHAWPYGTNTTPKQFYVYDIYADQYESQGGALQGSNGHSFFGNVFGGGSGYYPIAAGVWRRSAGRVNGNTTINITGGHILTSIYGGNETTDVKGKATINMSGGTLGVPRTLTQIEAHPVTCYLFGAGMGDPRTMFNQWTNVQNVELNITGGTIFGSVFGGGEEGHVLGNVEININEEDDETLIGTWGYSYVDGNIFGGGRGFSGTALTAGSVGGNIVINISDGKMLGSIYGGGRLASVGTYFVQPNDPNYGQLQPGTGHGYITVNITGGTIGNNHDAEEMAANHNAHTKGGNVFGGSMGRILLLDDTTVNNLWPRLACAKNTQVNITGTGTSIIKGNVYGGSEMGHVHEDAGVTLNNANVSINKIFGGGYGSDDITHYHTDSTAYPAQLAGRVMGQTRVEILNGTVTRNVFGGGELASVGWQKNDELKEGTAQVFIKGGFIGDNTMYATYVSNNPATQSDQDGHVYGGGQGKLNDVNEDYKFCCNVNHTSVTVQSGRIYGSVFGGGADSHVLGNTEVYITADPSTENPVDPVLGNRGMTSWDGNVFGGGKGSGKMVSDEFAVCRTSGRVGGNTNVTMSGGELKGSVFGGGRLGLTGVNSEGNPFVTGQVYDSVVNNIPAHGLATVVVSGGTIGTSTSADLLGSDESVGDIFGSGKGDCDYFDDIWAGRTANTSVTVTGSPRIYGSVFGGGEQSGVGYWNGTPGTFYSKSGTSVVTLGREGESDNPEIGTDDEFDIVSNPISWTIYDTINNVVRLLHTCTGNVFGAGQGDANPEKHTWVTMARSQRTYVNIHGGTIKSCVYGGAEHGTVMGDTHVNITNGTIGQQQLTSDVLNEAQTEVINHGTYSFGSVFGGGYGTKELTPHLNDSTVIATKLAGRTYGNTYVNISGGQVYENVFGGGDVASVGFVKNGALKNGLCTVNVSGSAIVGPQDGTGLSGYVYGGGKGVGNDYDDPDSDKNEKFREYCDVNSTSVTVNLDSAGRIYGSLYGGGSDGHTLGNTLVTLNGGTIGPDDMTATSYGGNIFGGGRNFLKKNFTGGRVAGNTHVVMNNGTVKGSVFGGGRMALTGIDVNGTMQNDVETTQKFGWTKVEVKGGSVGERDVVPNYTARTNGDVYGGGKGDMSGVEGHPAVTAMLIALTKNTVVEISGNARVYGVVYGGGEVANVGKYTWSSATNEPFIQGITLAAGTGKTKVTVSGGTIGANLNKMRPDIASNYDFKYNDDVGHVYGGGEGRSINPNDNTLSPAVDTDGNRLVNMMATVGSTDVTISGTAWVKGSVYGGAAMGHVRGDTKVTVEGGQIGAGYYPAVGTTPAKDSLYAPEKFFNPVTYFSNYPTFTDIANGDTLKECVSWDYDPATNRFFDPVALKADYDDHGNYNNSIPTNGHSWFGDVYGAGSGYYPYIRKKILDPTADSAVWNPEAGRTWGNSTVIIKGGHILSNVYGGGEIADVGTLDNSTSNGYAANTGKSVVKMSGGTVGIPRKKAQIKRDPFTSNLFGAGRGDVRSIFNTLSNVVVDSVIISNNAIVYGCVFGGAEVGHVIDSTNVLVKNDGGTQVKSPIIGTTGFSGHDGHVFGGGRGSKNIVAANSNWAAGRVGGNAHVKMTNGAVLGNLYGGGSVARVGVGVAGDFETYITAGVYASANHGLAKVDISGGFVGNDANGGRLLLMNDEKAGNVFGSGRGDPDEHKEDDFGRVANSVANVSGEATIYGSVFGGGQMANSGHWDGYANWYTIGTSEAHANIKGSPKIGTELEFDYENYLSKTGTDAPKYTEFDTIKGMKMIAHTRTGNVYGGGQGDVRLKTSGPPRWIGHPEGLEQGHCGSAEVNISGTPTIMSSVFGGADQGIVWGDTKVTVAGGIIGTPDITYDSLTIVNGELISFHHRNKYYHGNVYGGSYGADAYSGHFDLHGLSGVDLTNVVDTLNHRVGLVYGNASVEIKGTAQVLGNVYGGGDRATVGDAGSHFASNGNCTVKVSGGTIGPLDDTGLNAYVFGGGNGFPDDPNEKRKLFSNVDSTYVTVSGGKIWGSVFGGGNDSHTLGSTSVTINAGADIGKDGLSTWDGNIFGGGRNFVNSNHTNGRVAGNITITMDGGTIQGSIFGGGRMALTGVDVNGDPFLTNTTDHVYDSIGGHGHVTINVSGTTTSIGNTNGMALLTLSDESVGDIFGSGKGDTKNYSDVLAGRVANTKINISGSPRIYGSVFGGGEMAGIGYWYNANGKQVFYDKSGTSEVTIGREGESDNPVIGTDTEYTPEYAATNPDWTVYDTDSTLIHTCTGNVFGASQGDVNPNKPHWISMARSRVAKVVVNGGTIKSCVYGGAEQGTVIGNTSVTINGGTIGTVVNQGTSNEYNFGHVFGGGYGSHRHDYNASTNNDSLVSAKYVAGRTYGNIRVDVLGGLVKGDVYGGANYAYIGGYGTSPKGNVLLNIGSHTQVNQLDPRDESYLTVGPTIEGSVFGANNHSGTPYGNVDVNIIHTRHTAENYVPVNPAGGWTHDEIVANTPSQKYALEEVFGGGNHASYTPNATSSSGRDYTQNARRATVKVWYCENTIKDLYGGGDAADIGTSANNADVDLTVDGGRFYRIFSGGNGSTGTPANIYGWANNTINSGVINELYGGGNMAGDILHTNLTINEEPNGCAEFIDNTFGGTNEAPILGDVITDLLCGEGSAYECYGGTNNANIYGNVTLNVYGGITENVYGGSKGRAPHTNGPDDPGKAADIKKFPVVSNEVLMDDDHTDWPPENTELYQVYQYMHDTLVAWHKNLSGHGGNVTVNLYGGTITNVFGGSNINGNIEGNIWVNVIDEEDLVCPLDITNLYGGCNETNYEPTASAPVTSPVVNVVHIKEHTTAPITPGYIRHNVFGGSLGHTSNIVANPVVNIGYDATTMAGYIPEGYTVKPAAERNAQVAGNVYGGGSEGIVNGSTTVNVYEGEVGLIDYVKKHNSTTPTVLDSIIHLEYDADNHLVGGMVFGGGKGCEEDAEHGLVKGNSTVNIKGGHVQYSVYGGGEMASVGQHTPVYQTPGDDTTPLVDLAPDANTGLTTVNIMGGQVGPAPIKKNSVSSDNDTIVSCGLNGMDGYVFGGGKGKGDDLISTTNPYGAYYQFANVNNTLVTIEIPMPRDEHPEDSINNRLWGSVFGGAEDGHVLGNTRVNYVSGFMGTHGTTSYDGNIFGGGRNYFHKNYTAGRVAGNTTVEMSGGQLFGNIYGGGRLALTGSPLTGMIELGNGYYQAMQEGNDHGHTKVTVTGGTIGNNTVLTSGDLLIETFSKYSMGSVYGGGKGTLDGIDITGHPKASSLLFGMTKDTEVEISGTLTGTHVYGIVFGGGEIANVGKYTWKQEGTTISDIDVAEGTAKVTISGGTIGADKAKMRWEPGDGEYAKYPLYNDDLGYVYGGGEGYSDDPLKEEEGVRVYPDVNTHRFGTMPLLDLMSSVHETDVTISGGWVKASVFGGSESGHVMGNTKVTIRGGQIGAGHNDEDPTNDPNDKFYESGFINPTTTAIPDNMYGTYHWEYSGDYDPYDPAEIANHPYTYKPTDGKSWFGNVFGGGSGWFPYITNEGTELAPNYVSHWNPNSGKVWGNTEVNIEGGHILNNVYGANESTNVEGKATVKMSAGTVGVPLSAERYAERPLLGYVYGGGAGDERDVFDNLTNVDTTDVQITGGIIYGSVVGGSEDGHVLGDAKVAVSGSTTVIGSTGKSGYDGNVFGGGRNFFGTNVNSGKVGGKATIDMSNGVALGNVYGGGRNGSVNKHTHIDIRGEAKVGTDQPGVNQATILNGSVFGGGLGKAGGKLQDNAHLFANVDSTSVNISGNAMIYNSVFGGGDNGHVLKSTNIKMTGGTVGQRNTMAELVTDSLDHKSTNIYTGNVLGGGKGITPVSPGVYNDTTGIVFRNTYVTIEGGTVRHAVYGGGGLSHVGTFTRGTATNPDTIVFNKNTGITKVTVTGGIIGPTKADLTQGYTAEQINNNFKYIGGNAGWVFGAGCGLSNLPNLTFNDSTFVTIGGTAEVVGAVFGGGENGHVARNTRVDITGGTIGAYPLHNGGTVTINEGVYGVNGGVTFTADKAETYENKYGGGHRVFRGDVYGGGKGTDTIWVKVGNEFVPEYSHTAGRVYGNTTVNVSGGTIYQRVYGGGSLASVGKYTYYKNSIPTDIPLTEQIQRITYKKCTGATNVTISGGTIGTNGLNNGDVVGGGRGVVGNPHGYDVIISGEDGADQVARMAYVGSTNVKIESGANIRSNVYGGSLNGHVYGDTKVVMDGGTVGYSYEDGPGDTLKVHGGWHSNVYAGGGGSGLFNKGNKPHLSITSGRVFGNTNVTITGGQVYHNVYGGGAIASVGTYDLRANQEPEVSGTGTATVTIEGGIIGLNSFNPSGSNAANGLYDGRENGMVFGSGRGEIDSIGAYSDSLSFTIRSIVNIGKNGTAGPKVKGSVYGSGENGHVYKSATVNVYSGTIGCNYDEYATYAAAPTTYAKQLAKFPYRGNVYGGGCGTDKFTDIHDGKKKYNPQSGIVWGDAAVNVSGGYISRNVYGAGAMASVGYFTSTERHGADGDTLSWPCEFTYLLESSYPTTGVSTVNITGGHIGTLALASNPTASGCVYGSARGEAGKRYEMVPLANTKEAYVNVNFTPLVTNFDDIENDTKDVIIGSVFGSGESGHVYDTTSVTITKGLIAGSVFGAGDGTATYEDVLLNPANGNPLPPEQVHSITAGKVFGNTSVTVLGGYILHNVYGGGNLASVGKGNYNGEKPNDTYKDYGESGNFNVTTTKSGRTHVRIYGGQIGTDGKENGHVFGSSRGLVFPSINLSPRYNYSRDFFLGYTNKSYVTIGENVVANPNSNSPRIYGSVFGGGQDGHVRLNTQVIINDAEIGVAYGEGSLTLEQREYVGNVYGAGQGIDMYDSDGNGTLDKYCPSSGSVTRNTHVIIKGGHIHRDVFGGGSLATLGPPVATYYDPSFTTVDVEGGTIGDLTGVTHEYGGNVFGSSRGKIAEPGHDLDNMATVVSARVNIGKSGATTGPTVWGSVYGSGDNGHVKTSDTVYVYSGTIGELGQAVNIAYRGNVFGGGSGMDTYLDGSTPTHNPNAGKVSGHAYVFIDGDHALVHGSVFGGGNTSNVLQERVVTVNKGTVKGNVYGGGNKGIADDVPFTSLKTVNVRGGHICGQVFGSSNDAREKTTGDSPNWAGGNNNWSSFVNITGGTIDQNVYGAGYGGSVDGSVCVNVGLTAVKSAPTYTTQSGSTQVNTFYNVGLGTNVDPTPDKLIIGGNIFGGSFKAETPNGENWVYTYDITGYSRIFIDGHGYITNSNDQTVAKYMNLCGGIYGSGNFCESGEQGRDIILRNYGTRGEGEMTDASRILTTLQRAGTVFIDNSNVHFSGADDISQNESIRKYGVLNMEEALYVANGSGIVLGEEGAAACMDSIHELRSLHLKGDEETVYKHMRVNGDDNWEWIGVNPKGEDNTPANARLWYSSTHTTPLTLAQENVIIFNADSKLWVRYWDLNETAVDKTKYGPLIGFFRMKAEHFTPVGTESFAYARPKLTDNVNGIVGYPTDEDTWNKGDGGFLSYNTAYNFFVDKTNYPTVLGYDYPVDGDDGGNDYTNTKQYPYYNIAVGSKDNINIDMKHYREWVLRTTEAQYWYVDGRTLGDGGWGKDENHQLMWGHKPDMPKHTITGVNGIFNDNESENPQHNFDLYNKEKDIIFVVGPVESALENEDLNKWPDYPLMLFRYPGGHLMSNGLNDATTGTPPVPTVDYDGLVNEPSMTQTAGPGANKGAMIHVTDNLTLDNVMVNGLYVYNSTEATQYSIPATYAEQKSNVTEPMVVTDVTGGSLTLNLKGGTTLQGGYNNTNANVWYTDSDYLPTSGQHHGGALFVAPDETPAKVATVNVEGVVSIMDNKQYLKIGDADAKVINSNVYLPTFDKALTITDELDATGTHIGITSPRRNAEKLYRDNTFSPVAVAANVTLANHAWTNGNFTDDQTWFFTRDHKTTYYYGDEGVGLDGKTLYFGWTWANVVRTAPSTGYSVVDNDITVSTAEGLAWVTSQSAGLTVSPTDFSGKTISQDADVDMKQYVWVPIGTHDKPFKGTYDGKGHLIDSIFVDYIGKGDHVYHRSDYGLFGLVNGTVKRTFVVGGKIRPEGVPVEGRDGVYNIGGLVGQMDGSSVIAYSEAAEIIDCPNYTFAHEVNAGGLVGLMTNGKIHSSMAMSEIDMGASTSGPVGGLVGKSMAGTIYNSFVNAAFDFGSNDLKKVGGLIGSNQNATVKSCYVTLHAAKENLEVIPTGANFDGIVNERLGGTVNMVYLQSDYNSALIGTGEDDCKKFTPVISSDNLGYQYSDNFITGDTTLVARLNMNAYRMNRAEAPIDSTYAHWARPGLAEINGDLPVLLLSEFDGADAYQGGFRSVGTYAGGPALQYGGPARDEHELDEALERPLEKNSSNVNIPDYLFVYGDVSSVSEGLDISQSKVSIFEHASIKSSGTLATFGQNYVGISFDNSCGHAVATPGVNYGLAGSGGDLLPRDWHMFSTPLENAPLGFNYQETNAPVEGYTNFNTEHYSNAGHYNNPWFGTSTEFGWLNAPGSNECAEGAGNRYWMGSQDGYFPKSRGSLFDDNLSSLFIVGSDECPASGSYRYPYGMDFYTWTEPDYHWINFKRNGPNHWHTDGDDHKHINYYGSATNVNEETLIPGKGYLGAITKPTFMQSHGKLNSGTQTIPLTESGAHLTGWNLVGNPFHGYIDFDRFSANANNTTVLQKNSSNQPFYVVYDADTYDESGRPGSGFLYQPKDGSNGGEYAGRYIHPHQGFYVKLKDNATSGGTVSTSLQFTEDMLVERADVKSDSHFRGWERDYPLVNLYLSSDGGCRDVTVIELDRPEWGGATKLKELRVGNGIFYGHHGDDNYAAMFVEKGTPKVPLWFEAKEDDIYTMTWNTANGDFHSMYLIDNITGIQYDMLRNNTYQFEGHKNDYWSRFYIVFDVEDVDEHEINNFVFFNGSEWIVNGEGDLEFIDVLGHVLMHTHVDGGQTRVNLPKVAPALYFMRLTNGKECMVQKIVVK